MSDKTLKVLGIVAGVMVVLAIWVGSHEPTVEFDTAAPRYLIADLDPGRIAQIEVEAKGEKVVLAREGDRFVVASKLNYPASTREVNDLINRCAKIRCETPVSSNASNHATLNVDGTGEKSQTVRFLDKEGKPLVGVVVGPAESDPDQPGTGHNVRLVGEDRVYRTTDYVSFRTTGLDYVDKEIVNLQRDDISKVQVMRPDGQYAIVSPEKGKVELTGIPEGQKAKGKTYESVFGAAAGLWLTDFVPETEAKDLAFDSSFVVETRSKALYTFEVAKKAGPKKEGETAEPAGSTDKWFLRAKARYVGPASVQVEGASDEQLKENEQLLLSRDAVEAFNNRNQGWVYEVSSWKAESMTKPFSELVEDDTGLPEEVAASHVLIPYQGAERADPSVTRTKEEARALAQEVLDKANAGEDFEALARQYSSCPSKDKGGDLGTFKFDGMSKPFSEAAFKLEVGKLSGVVETEFGFHVIKRTK